MYNVVIIGAGQLGSRHLQAIKATRHECYIWVVDSCVDSLAKSKSIYDGTTANPNIIEIEFVQDLNDVPNHIDFLLISTGSGPRFVIFKFITDRCEVKNVVFEKVLFQKMDYYEETALILEKKNIKAWINTPRRMWEFYRKVRPLFLGIPAHMFMVGGNWGLGCNAIHFIDLYAYLTGDTSYKIDINGLNCGLYESKRAGYKEINGFLHCSFSKGGSLLLDSSIDDLKPILTITNAKVTFSISEVGKKCWIQDANGERIVSFDVPFQSQLTNLVLDDILDNGTCLLPTYKESDKLHRPFIKGVLDFMNNDLGIGTDICPLT